MKTYASNIKQIVIILAIGIILLSFNTIQEHNQKMGQEQKIKKLKTLSWQDIVAFRIFPETSYSYNAPKMIKFASDEKLVTEFFQALSDSVPYQPQHDRTLKQWGVQFNTQTARIMIRFYIPTDNTNIVVGEMSSDNILVMFKSHLLEEWYQTYNNRWLTPDTLIK